MTDDGVPARLRDALAPLVASVSPGCTFAAARVLGGGLSALTIRLDVVAAAGNRRVWILRCGSRVSHREYRLLVELAGRGVGAPRPLHFDASFATFSEPHLVVEFVEGAALYPRQPEAGFVHQAADRLALIHQVSPVSLQTPLPIVAEVLDPSDIRNEPGIDIDGLAAGLERARRRGRNLPAFLHGDFWPGNWIWRNGELAGVIDWEDARIGDPLYDLAICRLECLWFFGEAAMQALTARYVERSGIDLRDLPYWDLRAATRPLGQLATWAAGWPKLGRPDVTAAHMAERLQCFVDRARAAKI